jgi:hypothetical protein
VSTTCSNYYSRHRERVTTFLITTLQISKLPWTNRLRLYQLSRATSRLLSELHLALAAYGGSATCDTKLEDKQHTLTSIVPDETYTAPCRDSHSCFCRTLPLRSHPQSVTIPKSKGTNDHHNDGPFRSQISSTRLTTDWLRPNQHIAYTRYLPGICIRVYHSHPCSFIRPPRILAVANAVHHG